MLRSLFRPLSSRRAHSAKERLRRRHSWRHNIGVHNVDTQAPPLVARVFGKEAQHQAGSGAFPLEERPPMGIADNAYLCLSTLESDEMETEEEICKQNIIMRRSQFSTFLEEHPNNQQKEEQLIEYVKTQILEATSNSDLLMKAELLINEDWLGEIDAMPGNIYRIGAFGHFIPHDADLLSKPMLKAIARLAGCICIFLIQLFGPPLIFLSATLGFGREQANFYDWHQWALLDPNTIVSPLYDWHHTFSTKALGLVIMFAFILNALFVCLDEQKSWKDIYNTFRYLKVNTPNFHVKGSGFLYCGAFVNCWIVLWCSCDAYLVIGASRAPQDLLMDSLGLLFLYNLDDVGGELGFVDADDWPGLRLAWIYKKIVHPCPADIFDEEVLDTKGHIFLGLYNVTAAILVVMSVCLPVLAVFTPFLKIAPN